MIDLLLMTFEEERCEFTGKPDESRSSKISCSTRSGSLSNRVSNRLMSEAESIYFSDSEEPSPAGDDASSHYGLRRRPIFKAKEFTFPQLEMLQAGQQLSYNTRKEL
jgi:hypothetical protein